jgi:KDO2-lipid IV(A) lauroyltransferase
MDRLLYLLASILVKTIQAFPLPVVARMGRVGGIVFYWLDVRHRRVAAANMARSFGGELLPAQVTALVRENFRRLGENYCCAVKTAAMTWDELVNYCEFAGLEKFRAHASDGHPPNIVVALGHFGNFELYARFATLVPEYRCATTYRGLPQPSLNRLMQSLRERSGCLFFERRTGAAALKATMSEQGIILGLFADQHAGRGGVSVPFFGRDCSTTLAPAVFALRYHCPLHTGICYRIAPGRWRIEAGDEIPTREDGRARSTRDITLDINRAFEKAVRLDPANWFWVHNRWKPGKKSTLARDPKNPEQLEPAART